MHLLCHQYFVLYFDLIDDYYDHCHEIALQLHHQDIIHGHILDHDHLHYYFLNLYVKYKEQKERTKHHHIDLVNVIAQSLLVLHQQRGVLF